MYGALAMMVVPTGVPRGSRSLKRKTKLLQEAPEALRDFRSQNGFQKSHKRKIKLPQEVPGALRGFRSQNRFQKPLLNGKR